MNNVAFKVEGYAPDRVTDFRNPLGGNETWLTFLADPNNIYKIYKEMPKLLSMSGKVFIKMSHNSDIGSICYKEHTGPIATKIK